MQVQLVCLAHRKRLGHIGHPLLLYTLQLHLNNIVGTRSVHYLQAAAVYRGW